MAAQSQELTAEHPLTIIRRATPSDAEACGRICFEAFVTLADKHSFARDLRADPIRTFAQFTPSSFLLSPKSVSNPFNLPPC